MRRRAERVEALAQLGVVALPACVKHGAGCRRAEGVECGVVEPPRPQRPAEHEHAGLARADAEAGPRRGAVDDPGGGGQRAPHHPPFGAGAPFDGKGQEDPLRQRREQRLVTPRWLSASVNTSGRRRPRAARPTGPATYPPPPMHRVRADAAQQPARLRRRSSREHERAARAQKVSRSIPSMRNWCSG